MLVCCWLLQMWRLLRRKCARHLRLSDRACLKMREIKFVFISRQNFVSLFPMKFVFFECVWLVKEFVFVRQVARFFNEIQVVWHCELVTLLSVSSADNVWTSGRQTFCVDDTVLECVLRVGHSICMIFNDSPTVSSNDTLFNSTDI